MYVVILYGLYLLIIVSIPVLPASMSSPSTSSVISEFSNDNFFISVILSFNFNSTAFYSINY